ncbi:MAG: hypothetical protein LBC95_00580 [Candidatus Nomurabacteria bacterium]|jgi:hypothetical protein|nr:hypothetical protein [Candidatus Nomurabacteria bacterium]
MKRVNKVLGIVNGFSKHVVGLFGSVARRFRARKFTELVRDWRFVAGAVAVIAVVVVPIITMMTTRTEVRALTGDFNVKIQMCANPAGGGCARSSNQHGYDSWWVEVWIDAVTNDDTPYTGASDIHYTASQHKAWVECQDPGTAYPGAISRTGLSVTFDSGGDGKSGEITGTGGQDLVLYIKDTPDLKFQPVATSKVTNDNQVVAPGERVTDRINILGAHPTGSDVAKKLTQNELDALWPDKYVKTVTVNSQTETVNDTVYRALYYCVNAFGPFQTPQSRNPSGTYDADAKWWGSGAPNGSLDSTSSGSRIARECVQTGYSLAHAGACDLKFSSVLCTNGDGSRQQTWDSSGGKNNNGCNNSSSSSTKCTDYLVTFNGNASAATGQNVDSLDWKPGIYYLVTRIQKGMNSSTPDPDGEINGQRDTMMSTAIQNDHWYSPFAEASETVTVPFQPFVTSDVVDTNHYVSAGTPIVDKVTSHATDSIDHANNGYNATEDKDGYWLNNSSVKVCVKAWGPYQSPQNQSGAVTGNAPGQTAHKAQICTGDSGAPIHYTSAGQTRDFSFNTTGWAPGYYYFTEHIIKNDQAADTKNIIIGDFNSKFNPAAPEDEWAYVKFQPIAKSAAIGNRYEQDLDGEDRGANKGVVFDCDENYDMVTASDGTAAYSDLPPEYLHCSGVTDRIFFGAADTTNTSGEVVNGPNNDNFWPKTSAGQFEPINYEVKLYGPFKDPENRNPVRPAEGKITSNVPGYTWEAPFATQPIASTGVVTHSAGPCYPDLTNVAATNACKEKSSLVTFKQNSATHTGTGTLNTTDLTLAPGFYVTVVEILTNSNLSTSAPANPSNIGTKMANNFYSAWGDEYESISIPIPVYAWSKLAGSGSSTTLSVGDWTQDTIWVEGFSRYYWKEDEPGRFIEKKRTDALGRDYYTHSTSSFDGFTGKAGYFEPDSKTDLKVTLYRYDNPIPDGLINRNTYCKVGTKGDADRTDIVGQWNIKSQDYKIFGSSAAGYDLPKYTISQTGHYVYFVEFEGDARVYPFTSRCDDKAEQFKVEEDGGAPTIGTQIYTDNHNPAQTGKVYKELPMTIYDKVTVSGKDGDIKSGSYAKVQLFFRKGEAADVNTDDKVCEVTIGVNKTGNYFTKGKDGAEDCVARVPGYYYWAEGLFDGDNNPYPGQDIPDHVDEETENITVDWPDGNITTKAQPIATIGEPISDTAIVSNISEDDPRTYKIRIEAFGPQVADGTTPICTTPFYTWEKVIGKGTDKINGEYQTDTTIVNTPGRVFWVEHLDVDDDEDVDKGRCGDPDETTTIIPPPPPGTVTPPPMPFAPSSGFIVRSVAAVTGLLLGSLMIWRLLMHKPLLPWRK